MDWSSLATTPPALVNFYPSRLDVALRTFYLMVSRSVRCLSFSTRIFFFFWGGIRVASLGSGVLLRLMLSRPWPSAPPASD